MATATYLIAHTAPDGSNIAQAQVTAESEAAARAEFKREHPGREVTTIGVEARR